jgi:hypothetical protein
MEMFQTNRRYRLTGASGFLEAGPEHNRPASDSDPRHRLAGRVRGRHGGRSRVDRTGNKQARRNQW